MIEPEDEVGTSPVPSANEVKEVTLEDWCLLRLEGTIDEDSAESADEDCTECVTTNEDVAESVTSNEDPAESVTLNEGPAESIAWDEVSVVSVMSNKDSVRKSNENAVVSETDSVVSILSNEDPADIKNMNEVPAESITMNEVPAESITMNEVRSQSLTLNEDPVVTESGNKTEINEDVASSVTEDIINIADVLKNTKLTKVYNVNGSTFVEQEGLSSHDDDTILRYELYKVNNTTNDDDDDSDDEDIISELDIQTQTLPQGMIINSNVFLTDAQWHTMSLVDGDLFRCAVCQTYCDRANCEDHTKSTTHVRNIRNYKPLKRFDLSIVRKVNTSLHCGVCNEIFDVMDYKTHENSKSHEGNLLTAINKVSDLMFDSNLHKQACYDNQSSGNTDTNHLSTNRDVYHMDTNMNCMDSNIPTTDRNTQTPERDCVSTFNGINVYECSDNEDEYTYEGEEYCTPSQGISYASMASKPRSIELPKLLKIDLGNREVRVKFESWHMIDKLGLNKFYCMVCNVIYLIRFKTQHCVSCDHLERLARCTVVEEYPEYLIRKVGDTLYHCGLCNMLQHHDQMEEHLETTHPKKNKNLIDTPNVNSPSKAKKPKAQTNISNKNATQSRFKTESEKTAIVTKNLEYRMKKKIDPNFDIFGEITLSPFGFELRISALAFNVIMKRDDEYYCAICDKICADVKVHVEDLDHMEVMNMTPFIRPFKNNLTRAVRGTLHCSLCNKLVPVNNICDHNMDPAHTTTLAVAMGMVTSEKLDNTKKNNLTNNPNKADNLIKAGDLDRENGLKKPDAPSKLPSTVGVQKEPDFGLASTNQKAEKEDTKNLPLINTTQNEEANLIDAFNKMASADLSTQTGGNAAQKFPGQNASLHGQNAPFPGRNTPIPGQNAPLPGKNTALPGQHTFFPGQNASLPGQNIPFPGQNTPLPGRNTPIPGQNAPLPGQHTSFPGQNTPFPGQNISFPSQNVPFFGQNSLYLGQNAFFQGLNAPFPGQNASFTGQNVPFLGQNSTFPGQNPTFFGQNAPFLGQNVSFPGNNPSFAGHNAPFLHQNATFPGQNMPFAEHQAFPPIYNPLPYLLPVNSQFRGDPVHYTNFTATPTPYSHTYIQPHNQPISTTLNVPMKTGNRNTIETKTQNKTMAEALKKPVVAKSSETIQKKNASKSTNNNNNLIKTGDDNVKTADDNVKTADDNIKTADSKIKSADNNIKTANNKIKTADDNIIETVNDNNETDKINSVNSSIEEEEKEFDETEVVYVKFKNMHTSYFKIDYLSYNTLVYMDNGIKHCFVCSNTVETSALRKHVESRVHAENVAKNKFLDKYGVQLFRQMYLMYHCAICNVLMTRKEIKMHLDWAVHVACYDAAHEKRSKKNRKKLHSGIKKYVVETQKEAIFHNVNEPMINIISAYQIVPNLETNLETTEENTTKGQKSVVVKKKKMVILNNVVMKVSFDHWHGVTSSKNVTKCIICQVEIRPKEIMDHVATEYHNVALGKTFEKTYYPALVRKINENTVNCMICNLELLNNEYMIHEHVNGRRHVKNQEKIINDSSNSDSYTDCYDEYLNL